MKLQCTILAILIGTSCLANSLYEPFEPRKHEIVFSSSSNTINVFDPTPTTNVSGKLFPGGRGTDQLVIYTPDFGERTNTNEFGTEAIVQNNIVTTISGANSIIPQDGIVISGHGKAKNWINKNIAIGTKIYIDKENNIINTYTTSDSYLFETNEKISETKSMIDYYKNTNYKYNYDNSLEHIQNAKNYLKKAEKCNTGQEEYKKYTQEALKEVNESMMDVLPNIPGEVKGVWIRPTETTKEEIIATLNNMQKIGINSVFLETFYHGETIFPSYTMEKYGLVKQKEIFKSIDPLKIWISEGHKRNIKIHIWFQSFYVGNIPPANNTILGIYPQWGNKALYDIGNDNPTRSKSEHNGYFLDPANPEVQDFLTKLIFEIITIYKPDGINLDYIRYPLALSKNENGSWGYTKYARNDFNNMYGEDPATLTKEDELWEKWDLYRREQITYFVKKIGTLGKCNNTYISTVIFPDIDNAIQTKQQDWRNWSKINYINGFTPLFLTYDPNTVAKMMADINKVKSGNTDLYAGLFVTFMGGSVEDLVRQIHKARLLNANGIILFDYAHTTDKYTKMLKNSAFAYNKNENITNLNTNINKNKGKNKKHFLLNK